MDNKKLVDSGNSRLYVPADVVGQTVTPNNQGQESDDEIDLREIFGVLKRRTWLIILVAILVFAAVFVVTSAIQPIYRASTKIQIESEESSQVLSFDIVQSEGENSEFYQTQYELLKSHRLATAVIKDLEIESYFRSDIDTAQKGKLELAMGVVKSSLFDREGDVSYALGKYPVEERFLAGLTVSPVKKSQIVKISYDHENPELAKRIVDGLAKHFIEMTLQRRLDSAKDAQKFLDQKVYQASVKVEGLEKELTNYAKDHSIVQIDGESSQSLNAQKTAELNVAYTLAQGKRIEAEARYRELSQSKGVVDALESPGLQSLKKEIVALQGEYQKNLQQYKPAYPSMVSLRKQIYQLQTQLDNETRVVKNAARSTLQAEYLAAKEKEDSLRKSLTENKKLLLSDRDKGIEYGNLLRQVNIQRKVYEELLLRSTEVSIAAGIESNNISVVDAAILPYQAQSPNVKMNLALGGVLGLILGAVLAFLLEFLSNGVRSADDLTKLLDLPLLGVVPFVKAKNSTIHYLASVKDPSSATAESFSSIRTNLLFSSSGGVPKVISVTSAEPSEGKSSSCMNMAAAFARSGSKVLLVDADMRKPVVHKNLKLDNSQGLSSFLSSQCGIEDVIQDTSLSGISVITAGPVPPNPSELLSSEHMESIFELAPGRFDIVILDCPPVIGLADALIISNRSQATVMVCAYDMSDKRSIQGATDRLRQAHANLLGVLFTKVRSGYGHSPYYGAYQYEYGDRRLAS